MTSPPEQAGSSPGIPFVGLTGGIGSGKSAALNALERLGAAVLSSDAVVHDLYASPEVRDEVTARWGDEVAPGGVVDRAAIARRVFGDDEERRWLEALIWPRVGARMAQWRAEVEAKQPPPRAAVIEVPLLFESGLDRGWDATIAVIADEHVRARRAAARGHEAVEERAARQLSQADKAARATYVVRNDGTLEALEKELSSVLDRISP